MTSILGVGVYVTETDLLTQKEALGGEHGEAVNRRALRRAVRRRRFAHLALLLSRRQKAQNQHQSRSRSPPTAPSSATFAFPPDFLALSFLAAVFLTGLGFFSGAGERGVSSFPLAPLFLARSSGWMLGRTPPAAIVTPFSNCSNTTLHLELAVTRGLEGPQAALRCVTLNTSLFPVYTNVCRPQWDSN